MFAKTLERVLLKLTSGADFTALEAADMEERFQKLRDNGKLPRGREHRAARLTTRHIAGALLGLVPARAGWAGHAAAVLSNLHAVGGPTAGLLGAPDLLSALEALLDTPSASARLVSLRLSAGEHSKQLNGSALFLMDDDGQRRAYGYASQFSSATFAPGLESWDPESSIRTASRDLRLTRHFFRELSRAIAASAHVSEPPGEGKEYDADDARRLRERRLKIRPSSYFLNRGVDTQVAWPHDECLVPFDGYELVLMPKTAKNRPSVHIDLNRFQLTSDDAETILRRFLSVRSWEDDQFAILEDGWAGNSGPAPVSRRNLAFMIGEPQLFARRSAPTPRLRRALAHYRAGCNALEADLVSYAFLSFWKILELKFKEDNTKISTWIAARLPALRAPEDDAEDWARFDDARGTATAERYLLRSCRVAVAHASVRSRSDEDDAAELLRLHRATRIVRLLARDLMENDFKIDAALSDTAPPQRQDA